MGIYRCRHEVLKLWGVIQSQKKRLGDLRVSKIKGEPNHKQSMTSVPERGKCSTQPLFHPPQPLCPRPAHQRLQHVAQEAGLLEKTERNTLASLSVAKGIVLEKGPRIAK